MQVNIIIAVVFGLLVLILQGNVYSNHVEVLELKAELKEQRDSDIRYYNDCLSSSVAMSDIKSCISVHGH